MEMWDGSPFAAFFFRTVCPLSHSLSLSLHTLPQNPICKGQYRKVGTWKPGMYSLCGVLLWNFSVFQKLQWPVLFSFGGKSRPSQAKKTKGVREEEEKNVKGPPLHLPTAPPEGGRGDNAGSGNSTPRHAIRKLNPPARSPGRRRFTAASSPSRHNLSFPPSFSFLPILSANSAEKGTRPLSLLFSRLISLAVFSIFRSSSGMLPFKPFLSSARKLSFCKTPMAEGMSPTRPAPEMPTPRDYQPNSPTFLRGFFFLEGSSSDAAP